MTLETSATPQQHPVLQQLGYAQPTEIQKQAIPVLANGESLLAFAPTGSGKTLAFLIPLMQRIDPSLIETQLLILAPTRELGAQIAQVAQQVAESLATDDERRLIVRTVFGGQKAETQRFEISKKPSVVIATPGRALELIKQDVLKISELKSIVLDEADVMVGMGFEAQVKSICDFLPPRIQAALFSATETEGQSRLQNRLVFRGKRVDVREPQACPEIPEQVALPQSNRHETVMVPQSKDRLVALGELLEQITPLAQTGIIFCQTRESVQRVTDYLQDLEISAAGLSGELGQIERTTILRRFKAGGFRFLVATNLASRGIDVSDLSVVVNFELPSTPQEYLHRAGRSGRAGKPGWTVSLCTPQSRIFLVELLKDTKLQLTPFQASTVEAVCEAPAENKTTTQFVKIHINRGKSSKLRPGDFLGALTKEIGLMRDDVGGIFIFDHFTHVEIAMSRAHSVLTQMGGRKIKNMSVKVSEANTLEAPRRVGFKN